MSNRDTKLLLNDMLQAAIKIQQYTNNLDFKSFFADEKTKDAVVRNFEIIGEASNRVNDEIKETIPEI